MMRNMASWQVLQITDNIQGLGIFSAMHFGIEKDSYKYDQI